MADRKCEGVGRRERGKKGNLLQKQSIKAILRFKCADI